MINPYLTAVLPFYSVELVLMFDEDSELPFFHRAHLSAFFRHLLGQNHTIDYQGKLAIETCEDGQTHYRCGDYYRCSLTAYEGGLTLLTQLLTTLKQLPDSLPKNIPKSAPFAQQMRFVGFYDRLRNGATGDVLTPYTEQTLLCELDLWRNLAHTQGLNIRTLSPLAIHRKDDKGKQQLCRNPDELTVERFFKACADSLQNLARAQGKRCTVALNKLSIDFQKNHIVTVKDGYRKPNHPKKNGKGYWKSLDGVVGLMQLPADTHLNDDYLTALILAAYCGVGANTTFGLGRYQLETLDGKRPDIQTPLQPDETLWQQGAERQKQQIIQQRTDKDSLARKPLPADEAMRLGIASLGTVLTVSGNVKKVSSLKGHVQIYDKDRLLHHQPWTTLHSLSLVGTQHITTPALKYAMKHEVAVHFIESSGKYLGSTVSQRWQKNRLSLIKAQLALTQAQSLALAKNIVIARTRHIKEVLRQKSAEETKKCRQTLTRLQEQAEYARHTNQLLGVEGYVMRAYYRQMRAFIDAQWQFEGRNRRPPRDPINAMLSLGYSTLYAHVQAMILADGLHPDVGFYHQMRPGHAALASDLMEPFRHIVEQSCWKLVNTGILTPSDFDKRGDACYFHADALKRYFQELNARFQKPLQHLAPVSEAASVNLYGQIHQQNISLINTLTQGTVFEAYKYR